MCPGLIEAIPVPYRTTTASLWSPGHMCPGLIEALTPGDATTSTSGLRGTCAPASLKPAVFCPLSSAPSPVSGAHVPRPH